jgi:hypothetical protein
MVGKLGKVGNLKPKTDNRSYRTWPDEFYDQQMTKLGRLRLDEGD